MFSDSSRIDQAGGCTQIAPSFFSRIARKIKSRATKYGADSVLNHLSDLLVEDPILRVDEFQGLFCVGKRSDLFRRIAKEKEYEPRLAKVCLAHLNPDRDAVDVGANIGFYSVLFAKNIRDRKVLSIEPVPSVFERLGKNLVLNGIQGKALLFNGVASAAEGRGSINIVPGREEYSSMGAMVHPSIAGVQYESIKVAAQTVDFLCQEYALDVGFVKMDVEGMEHVVLGGMHQTLSKSRPVVLLELCDPMLRKNESSSQEVIRKIQGYGYDVVDPLNPSAKPGSRSYSDLLCIPK